MNKEFPIRTCLGCYNKNNKAFVDNLAEGVVVTHKKYGSGVIIAMEDNNATILFEDTEKVFNMRVLFQNKLIE